MTNNYLDSGRKMGTLSVPDFGYYVALRPNRGASLGPLAKHFGYANQGEATRAVDGRGEKRRSEGESRWRKDAESEGDEDAMAPC